MRTDRRVTPDAGLGWRSHSGWAVLVAVSGPPEAVNVLARRRVELVDSSLPRQPYHVAVEDGLSADDAAALIERVQGAATAAAVEAAAAVVAEVVATGSRVVGVGLAGGGRHVPAELTKIMASHTLLHAAEGDLFDNAIAEAAATAGLPLVVLPPKAIFAEAATVLSMQQSELDASLASAGKLAGPPWQKDHREAAAAALVASTTKSRSRFGSQQTR